MASIYELHIYNTQAPSKTYHMPYKLDSDREKKVKGQTRQEGPDGEKCPKGQKGLECHLVSQTIHLRSQRSHTPHQEASQSQWGHFVY